MVRHTLCGGEHRGVTFDRVLNAGSRSPAAKQAQTSPAAEQAQTQRQPPVVSDKMKLEVMGLEVLRDQLKAEVSSMQERNLMELRDLGAEGTAVSASLS